MFIDKPLGSRANLWLNVAPRSSRNSAWAWCVGTSRISLAILHEGGSAQTPINRSLMLLPEFRQRLKLLPRVSFLRIHSQRRTAGAQQHGKADKEKMFHTIASASLGTTCDAWSCQLRENLELWGRAFKSSAREPGNANNPPAAAHN